MAFAAQKKRILLLQLLLWLFYCHLSLVSMYAIFRSFTWFNSRPSCQRMKMIFSVSTNVLFSFFSHILPCWMEKMNSNVTPIWIFWHKIETNSKQFHSRKKKIASLAFLFCFRFKITFFSCFSSIFPLIFPSHAFLFKSNSRLPLILDFHHFTNGNFVLAFSFR